MNKVAQRISALAEVGRRLDKDFDQLPYGQITAQNPWFTTHNTKIAIRSAVDQLLNEEELEKFAAKYSLQEREGVAKTVGVVMAGNIPLVGLHDFICVFLSGAQSALKFSSRDEVLMTLLVEYLLDADPTSKESVTRVEKLNAADAVIATGSNNTFRYFEYYFRNTPNILRKNRNSVAVLTAQPNAEEAALLGNDIFHFFGLGCRNVSKVYVPERFDINALLEQLNVSHSYVRDHTKYMNNFDYQLAILLMNQTAHQKNDFLLAVESEDIYSPLSMVHFERYTDIADVNAGLKQQEENIQCVVSNSAEITDAVSFGNAQQPGLTDYADGVDVMGWLLKL